MRAQAERVAPKGGQLDPGTDEQVRRRQGLHLGLAGVGIVVGQKDKIQPVVARRLDQLAHRAPARVRMVGVGVQIAAVPARAARRRPGASHRA